jgi:hypothetical protein
MKKQINATVFVLITSCALLACGKADSDTQEVTPEMSPLQQTESTAVQNVKNDGEVVELQWDDLVPKDWVIDDLIEEYNATGITDDDPRAQALLEKIKEALNKAPVVEEYDGKQVRLPGFVVPLEMNATSIRELLLVPYFGACVHVPPPPANQTVYVVTQEDAPYKGELYDTVWVTGTMRVERLSSQLGDTGYSIDATRIEPFQ